MGAQIVHVELALGHARRHAVGVFGLDAGGGFLDHRDDVAHAQDAARNALWMKGLDRIKLFAGGGKFDRLAGDRAHR